MNLFTITGEIVLRGKDTVEKQLLNLSGTTNNVTNRMEQNFKRLGTAVLTAFSVKALINFGKQIAQTSATVHEEVAQFEAVLGDLQDKMNEGIQRVSKNTGILETRLRKTSTAVFAMFKGASVDSETALTNTERFLQIASDASAFYDKSMEEVQGDLQSFMRGITRAGYGIGLYTSELQRNEKAMEMFGTTYDKLGQAERYEVMLEIIEQTYKLAGVTGQANREQEQWLNVTSNLKEAWKQFSAVLGQPVMEALLKPMKAITDTLLKWKDRLTEFYTWWNDNKSDINSIPNKIIRIATALGLTVVALSGLTIIKNIIPLAIKLVGVLAGNWLTILIGGLAVITVEFMKLYNTSEDFRNNVTNLADTFISYWDSKVKPKIDEIANTCKPLFDEVIGLFNDVKDLISALWNNIVKPIIDSIAKFVASDGNLLVETLQGVVEALRGIVQMLTAILNADMDSFVEAFKKTFEGLWQFVNNGFQALWGLLYVTLEPIVQWFANLGEAIFESLKAPFERLRTFLTDFWDTIKDTFTKLGTSIGNAIGDAVLSGINGVLTLVENTINGAIKLINGAIDIMNKVPLVNIPHVKELDIPKLAKGGVTEGATLAEIGEAGKEAVIPLENKTALSEIANALGDAIAETFDFSSIGVNLNIQDIGSNIWSKIKSTDAYKSIANALGIAIDETTELDEKTDEVIDNADEKTTSFWEKLKNGFKKLDSLMFNTEGTINEIFTKISDKFEQITDYVASYIAPLFDSIAKLQDQRSQQEIDRLEADLEAMKEQHETENELAEESYNQQLKDLYHMLDVGSMSYEEYTNSVKKLNADMEADKQAKLDEEAIAEQELLKKKDDLARKQFESQKATSIAMVWVNTAQAIMKAFSELGVIGGAVATALLLATAGVQTALIAEQKYEPMLATGGVIDRPTRAIIGEDGAEAVVPLERNLGWVNGLATALEPTINANNIDYTPEIHTISEQLDEMKQLLANFLPMFAQQQITLDGAVVGRKITPYIDGSFGIRQRYADRGI